MEEDLRLRGLSPSTRQTYLYCAAVFVRHCGRGPMRMGRAKVRAFLLHLREERRAFLSRCLLWSRILPCLAEVGG